jgi:hypothetical protein
MSNRTNTWRSLLLAGMMPFLLACLYLQNMIQVPEPKMETNPDVVIEVLNGSDWMPLQSLASETYSPDEFAQPGTLTFTVKVTNEKPVYFNYGWCTTSAEILAQNFEHITVDIFFNDGKLGSDVVHNLTYSLTNGQVCSDFGVLMSDWPAGTYTLKAAVNFDQKINDGMSDFEAGDYIYIYNVRVEE